LTFVKQRLAAALATLAKPVTCSSGKVIKYY